MPAKFSTRILNWFVKHGRKDLPWQRDIDPYRVWVSEIMLQQTQVKTVIPYFERFLAAFPTVNDLAAAPQDEVLHLWTGLGYYARARNLHAAANKVAGQYGGAFPADLERLCELPGVGRSTAGAILSIAFGRRAAILDGNVKRVLSRYRGIGGWPGQAAVHRHLWQVAEEYTPRDRCAEYTQAIMDLGATLCKRSSPHCHACPLERDCVARACGTQSQYPGRNPKKPLPVRSTRFLMIRTPGGDVWLEKRPPTGIWGGLWCFPESGREQPPARLCRDRFGIEAQAVEAWPEFRHTFSHYHLDIEPVLVTARSAAMSVMEAERQLWYNVRQPPQIGLAAPIAGLLKKLT